MVVSSALPATMAVIPLVVVLHNVHVNYARCVKKESTCRRVTGLGKLAAHVSNVNHVLMESISPNHAMVLRFRHSTGIVLLASPATAPIP